MKTSLSVNLNKIALLRNQRRSDDPSILDAARAAISAGADGITVHPRPDERHVRFADVRDLGTLIEDELRGAVELNVEGYPSRDFLRLVLDVVPTQVTLVPDAPDQATSDHGWNLAAEGTWLTSVVCDLAAAGIRVSLFVEPDEAVMSAAKSVGAHRIELYTGPYARAFDAGAHAEVLTDYRAAADAALANGLGVNAGHDLALANLPAFKHGVPMVAEVSIGQALIADALRLGLSAAVRAYRQAVA